LAGEDHHDALERYSKNAGPFRVVGLLLAANAAAERHNPVATFDQDFRKFATCA